MTQDLTSMPNSLPESGSGGAPKLFITSVDPSKFQEELDARDTELKNLRETLARLDDELAAKDKALLERQQDYQQLLDSGKIETTGAAPGVDSETILKEIARLKDENESLIKEKETLRMRSRAAESKATKAEAKVRDFLTEQAAATTPAQAQGNLDAGMAERIQQLEAERLKLQRGLLKAKELIDSLQARLTAAGV